MANDKKSANVGKVLLGLLVLIGAVLLALVFGSKGAGGGEDGSAAENGKQGASSGVSAQNTADTDNSVSDSADAEAAVAEVKYEDVVITGDTYLWNGGSYELDALITELKGLDENTQVMISEDEGNVKALDELKSALDENGISYIEDIS